MANRPGRPPVHELVYRHQLLKNTIYRPEIPLNRWRRLLIMLKYWFKIFVISPSKSFRCLNFFEFGKDAINGNLIVALYSYLKTKRPDFIHCHFATNSIILEKILGILKWDIPFFVSFHGFDTRPENLAGRSYDRIFEKASRIFVNSIFLRNKVEALGCSRKKISIIPVGLLSCDSGFDNSEGKEITLLTVGRLIELKGLKYSLRAFSQMFQAFPDLLLKYQIIGEGPLRGELEREVCNLGLTRHVEFLGALPAEQVREYYKRSTFFVLTGITLNDGTAETQGLVYQEAACAGLPSIASDAGGVAEYVLDGVTGLIAREGDVKDIAEKMKDLIGDPDLRNRLGKEGKKRAEQNFKQEVLTQKMITIYESY